MAPIRGWDEPIRAAAAAVLACLAVPAIAGAEDPRSSGQAAREMGRVLPQLLERSHRAHGARPTIRRKGSAFATRGTGSRVSFGSDPARGSALRLGPIALRVTPARVDPRAGAGHLVGRNAVAYARGVSGADLLIRPRANGIDSVVSISRRAASARYTWRVGLADGQRLARIDDSTVAVLGPLVPARQDGTMPQLPEPEVDRAAAAIRRRVSDRRPAAISKTGRALREDADLRAALAKLRNAHAIAVVRAPWAIDARGRRVPLSLSARGSRITLRVGHRGRRVVHPVLADTAWGATRDARGTALGTAVRYKELSPAYQGWYERDGMTLRPDAIGYSLGIASRFRSVTPENELKMVNVEPRLGVFDYGPADAVVDWARANGLSVRGHALLYGDVAAVPYWLKTYVPRGAYGCTDVGACVREHARQYMASVMDHFRGRVDRWDVVNEPFDHPCTAQQDFFKAYRAVGLQVEVTEMDVGLARLPPPALRPVAEQESDQTAIYEAAAGACRDVGCRRFSVWGADDDHSWKDEVDGGYEPWRFATLVYPQPRDGDLLTAHLARPRRAKPVFGAVTRALRGHPARGG